FRQKQIPRPDFIGTRNDKQKCFFNKLLRNLASLPLCIAAVDIPANLNQDAKDSNLPAGAN
ncbi:MAG TPA: hypothetical protein VIH17_11660, partial [Candidatus Acidoferrales bacterium]